MTTRWITILLVLNGLLLPVGCLPVIVVLNAFNPMQKVFIADIHVTNATDAMLWITPIGARRTLKRSQLPIFASKSPAFASAQTRDFAIRPDETLTLLYDWDDINLSEIVVRNGANEYSQITVDPQPPTDAYYKPEQNRFAITNVDSLDPIAPDVLAAATTDRRTLAPTWPMFLMLIPWLTFALLIRWRRRAVGNMHIGPSHGSSTRPAAPNRSR